MIKNLLKSFTKEQEQKILSQYLPSGYIFLAKSIKTSKLYKLLLSFANSINILRDTINFQLSQYIVYQTVDYINEYEKMLGVNRITSCFTNEENLQVRQSQVYALLKGIGVQTCKQLVDVIALLGVNITCRSANSKGGVFPYKFPVELSNDGENSFCTVVISIKSNSAVSFPYKFPVVLSESNKANVNCFIEYLIPAHVKVIYEN